MKSTSRGIVDAVGAISAVAAFCCCVAACKAGAGPNTAAPEDKLLYELGQAQSANDRVTGVALYDLEVRQKLDVWEHSLKSLHNSDQQLAAFQAVAPRISDKEALVTVGGEAWTELKELPWAEELGAGKCVSGPIAKEDIGRGVMPKESEKQMAPEVGQFIFGLRTSVNWLTALRVSCPTSGSFWVQLAQRKRTDPAKEQPLRIVRVGK